MNKTKLNTILTNKYIPFICLFALVLVYHLIFPDTYLADDVTIAGMLDGTNMFDYLVNRYNTWSSRMLMEIIVYVVGCRPLLWRVLNSVMLLLLGYSISQLVPTKNEFNRNLIISCFVLLHPMMDYTSAGWMATSMSYLWPLTLELFAFIPIRRIIMNEKVKWWEFILFTAATIISITTEQSCALMFGFTALFMLYFFIKKKFKYFWFLMMQFVFSVIKLIIVFTCPGNSNRSEVELRWFPEYENFSIIKKLELGYSTSLTRMMLEPHMIFLAFCAILALTAYVVHKNNKFIRTMAFIPLFCQLVFGVFKNVTASVFPQLNTILEQMRTYSYTGHYDASIVSFRYIFILELFMGLICLDILAVLFFTFKNKELSLLSIIIIVAGFASKMAVTISPTLYASSTRTSIYLYFSFAVVGTLLYREFSKTATPELKSKCYGPSIAGMLTAAGVTFLNGVCINLPVV